MSQQGDHDVQVEIQRTLSAINDVTIKIKKELMAITDLVREKGRLNTAVDEANEALFVAGINATRGAIDGEENDEESESFPLPITSDIITQKISSLLEDSDARSQQ